MSADSSFRTRVREQGTRRSVCGSGGDAGGVTRRTGRARDPPVRALSEDGSLRVMVARRPWCARSTSTRSPPLELPLLLAATLATAVVESGRGCAAAAARTSSPRRLGRRSIFSAGKSGVGPAAGKTGNGCTDKDRKTETPSALALYALHCGLEAMATPKLRVRWHHYCEIQRESHCY